MTKIFSGTNKKGFVTDMQLAVIAVITLVVLGLFAYKAYVGFRDKLSIQSCKTSIEAHSLIARGSFREIFTDIKCPTKEINIKDLKKTKEIIAEDMHRCWYIWGKGNGQYFKGDGNYCHICSIYSFDDKGQKVSGLIQYLAVTPIKIKYTGDNVGITYQDYFQGYTTPNSAEKIQSRQITELADMDVIDTSQKYATIFVYASGKNSIDKMLEGGKRTTAATAGGTAALLGVAATGYGTYAGIGLITSITTGATTVAAANFWNPVGWVVGGVVLVGAGVYVLVEAFSPENPEWIAYIAFRPYDSEELKNLECDQIVVNQMSNAAR
ncbi:MAG: hypothetical protein ACP5N1_01650 [Candidatus Woesearchaeota archaeon]